jgi:hypothetical protein
MVLIMIKLLDYYYLVLLRGFGYWLDYYATGLMGATFTVNLFSFVLLFNFRVVEQDAFWITTGIVGLSNMIVVNLIYNNKRKERIRREHKRESRESRQRGVLWVVVYELLSLTFLILAISRVAIFYNP